MATPADLLAQIAAAVEAQVSGAVRLASDYRDDLEPIPAGATRYQVRGGPSGRDSDSNETRTVESVEVSLHHALSGAERVYTEGAMQSDVAALIALSFWRGLAAVAEVIEPPGYEVEREALVVSVTVSVEVSITP